MLFFDAHLHSTHSKNPALPPGIPCFSCASSVDDWPLLAAEDHKEMRIFLGLHPIAISERTEGIPLLMEQLKAFLTTRPDAGIGECGLDQRYYKKTPRHLQEKILHLQIDIASQMQRALVLHQVKAAGNVAEIIEHKHPDIPIMLHGFRGKQETAQRYLKRGVSLSLGPGRHWEDESFQALVRRIPRNKLLLESDWPYTPGPYLKTIETLYETAARILGIDRAALLDIVRTNGQVFTD